MKNCPEPWNPENLPPPAPGYRYLGKDELHIAGVDEIMQYLGRGNPIRWVKAGDPHHRIPNATYRRLVTIPQEEQPVSKQYHLICPRGGYWRPKGEGYTTDVREAGLFDEAYAQKVVNSTHGDHRMIEVVVPESGSYILVSNLESTLNRAIADAHWLGESQSAFVAGLEANLAYLRAHGTLEIRA